MKKVFKSKLVKALRSGRYQQGTGSLVDAEGFRCCLGVACAVLGLRSRNSAYRDNSVKDGSDLNGEGYPTPRQMKAMGLRRNTAIHLASMNDDGKSFAEIADHIEKRLRVTK